MDSLSLIVDTLAPLDGKSVLDVGCGPGALSKALAKRGARMTGVDPAEDMIAAARAAVPDARFEIAGGENLPFEDGSFAAAIFLNSLHHVPGALLRASLREAGRVVAQTDGLVIVVEPLARGSFFAALRPIEDETAVRDAAQAAIRDAVQANDLLLLREIEFVRHDAFERFDEFVVRVVAADASRAAVIKERRTEIEASFEAAATRDEAGRFALDQPLRAQILAPPAR